MRREWIWMLLGLGLLLSAAGTAAQETAMAVEVCGPAVETLWTTASDACVGGPPGYVCNGGAPPAVEPQGPIAHTLAATGALVEAAMVDSIRTLPVTVENGSAGIAWLRLPPPLGISALLVGDVTLRDITPPEFPAWQSMLVQTAPGDHPTCPAAPRSLLVVQNQPGQPANIAINGVSLGLNGTVLVLTQPDVTVFIGLSGNSPFFAAGQSQTLRTGEQISVPYSGGNFAAPAAAPSAPQLFDPAFTRNLPVALLDRPLIVPQAGYVATQGQVNMRSAPSTDAGVLAQIPAGVTLSVLGRNPAGDWLHVQLENGDTGWMFAELLTRNLGSVDAIYEATPMPPQRYGELGRIAKIIAPTGVNLRQAPDVSFPAITAVPNGVTVTLLARSPYSPWVKIEYNGLIGWVALVTLETEALLDALPVDLNVPPPPTPPPPTRVPGSFGNAFPDPKGKP